MLVAVFSMVMFVLAAIIVDLGSARSVQVDAQSAVDAAALAGAAKLYDEPDDTPDFSRAVDTVKDLAEANFGTASSEWSSCTAALPPGWTQGGSGTSCIGFDSAVEPILIQVVLPARRTEAAFGGLVGYSGVDVTAQAQAQTADYAIKDCSLCVMGFLTANGVVTVDGDGSAVADDGSVNSAGRITVVGGGRIGFRQTPSPSSNAGRYAPNPPVAATPSDPFAGAEMPPLVGLINGNNTTCNGPGDLLTSRPYRNVTVSGMCPLPFGTVVVTGNLTYANGTSVMTGSPLGSTLFFGCRDGNRALRCDENGVDGRGRLNMARGTLNMPQSYFEGLAVLYDPDNNQPMTVNGVIDADGGLYARRSRVTVGGTGRLDVTGLVSVERLTVNGGRVNVSASGLGASPGPSRLALFE